MTLSLCLHPLSSYCHKALIALYENGTPFEPEMINLGDEASRARFFELWPLGKIPVLRDHARGCTIPETSIIIEHLERHYPGRLRLLPEDTDECLQARLWDRVFDFYVMTPMQQIVGDRLRPAEERDARGVAEARATLAKAYALIERQVAGKTWAIGERFSLADCAAAPALFYAGIVAPFAGDHPQLSAYFERLLQRPSVARVIDEARPYFQYFPYRDAMPQRFL